MRRLVIYLFVAGLLFTSLNGPALADQQTLTVASFRYYAVEDLVFVDIQNLSDVPVERIVVNLMVQEGTGRNRVLAEGQTVLPPTLVLQPGQSTSAQVPLQHRLLREIPRIAQFEFTMTGLPATNAEAAQVVVQGGQLRFHRTVNGTPLVAGFMTLDATSAADATAQVTAIIYTFYDRQDRIVWSETVASPTKLMANDATMLWQTFRRLTRKQAPDIQRVSASFVMAPPETQTN